MLNSEERKLKSNKHHWDKFFKHQNWRILPSINPNEIARSLCKPINRNICSVEVFESWPPTAVQVIEIVFLAQLLDSTPVRVGCCKPFAVAWTDVDVYRAKVVVLLMARRSTVGYFHVQLHGVHPKNHVTNVWQHIRGRHNASEWRKLLEFCKLRSPLPFIG